MTEQEQKDVDAMNAAIIQKKLGLFGLLETLDRATPMTLEQMGCKGKTQGEAMQLFYQMAKKEIDKMLKAHVRKYPD